MASDSSKLSNMYNNDRYYSYCYCYYYKTIDIGNIYWNQSLTAEDAFLSPPQVIVRRNDSRR